MTSTKKKQPAQTPDHLAFAALMQDWPASWAGVEQDKPPGRRLVTELRPFIAHLLEQGLTAKTVRRHLDNLWALCGDVVTQFNDDSKLRRRPAQRLLLDSIGMGEAPLIPHATEAEQRSADATARKLLKFLLAKQ